METRLQDIEKKLQKVLYKIKPIEEINRNTQILHRKLENLLAEFESYKQKIISNEKETDVLKSKVNLLESENRLLKEEVQSLRGASEECLYNQKINELEVNGIPDCTLENFKSKLNDIMNKNGLNSRINDIQSITRPPSRNNRPSNINISFKDKFARNEFLDIMKKAKLRARDFGLSNVNNNNLIFFNEWLPSFTRHLLFTTRNLKKAENWKFVWVKDGKIFIRRKEGDAAIRITSMKDLEILKSAPLSGDEV